MDENDTGRALFPIAAVGLSMVALITAKTGRDAVFLSCEGRARMEPRTKANGSERE